jgi:hypothetical protein
MFRRRVQTAAEQEALALVPDATVRAAFKDPPIVQELDQDLIVYRQWGNRAAESGRWFSPQPYSSPARARPYLALPNGITAANTTAFRLPAGTKVLVGRAAPQTGTIGFGSYAVGGGDQICLPDPTAAVRIP